MADDDAPDDKTEQATARRLGLAADEGRVPISRDLALWVGLVAGILTLMAVGGALRDAWIKLVAAAAGTLADPNFSRLVPYFADCAKWGLLVCVAAAIGGGGFFALQTGGRVWPSLLSRGVDTLFSGGGIKRVFSKKVLGDVGMSLVKVLTVGIACWFTLRDDFMTLPALIQARPDAQFAMLFKPLVNASVKVLASMAVFAGLDFALTRYRHLKSMRMTKQELKREIKEEEGDPAIRMQRKRRHRDLLRGRATVEVPRADVLLVNPTHIAIALRYRPGSDRAPIVTAKGKGDLAEFMRNLARSNGIPIVEDIPLARLLYRKVKVGRSVPAQTYKAVAAILAFVYRITHRATGVASAPEARP